MFHYTPMATIFVPIPSVEPPAGYGYALDKVTHDTPHENCSCGIYAARDIEQCPGGDVFGKVKLWGKIVPGEKGSRAEYAYPSELHVPAKLAGDPAILAYGVPVIVDDAPARLPGVSFNAATTSWAAAMTAASSNFQGFSMGFTEATSKRWRVPWYLGVATGLNLCFAAWDILVAFKVIK
jgi:hypothetical protein